MGNNASHSGNITPCSQLEKDQRWVHSSPRNVQRLNQHKVLPDLNAELHSKLRHTNNGEILYSGGTISGRHQNGGSKEGVQNGIYRSNSMSFHHSSEHMSMSNGVQSRSFVSNQLNPLHKSSPRKSFDMHHRYNQYSHRDLQIKGFGSVPDLRDPKPNYRDPQDLISKGRKKYKAPPPPLANLSNESENWDRRTNGEIRKTRLFKTKGETKKKPQSPSNCHNEAEKYCNVTTVDIKNIRQKARQNRNEFKENDFDIKETQENPKNEIKYNVIAEIQRSRSMPDFQAELLEATQKLKSKKVEEYSTERYNFAESKRKYSNEEIETNELKEHKLKTLDHNIMKRDYLKYEMRQMESQCKKEKNGIKSTESIKKCDKKWDINTNKEFQSSEKMQPKTKELPSKMFYFGMDETTQASNNNNNVIDIFASSLHMRTMLPNQTYSESEISSEVYGDNGQEGNEIALHLRPILPKKQLETPRFSPAAAWRLLSALEANPTSSTVSDDGLVFVEDRIEKYTRQPIPESVPVAGSRSNHDKSGDSGISGDAGLPGFEENNEPVLLNRSNNLQISSTYPHNLSWTPQQDLEGEEESSSEGEENRNRNSFLKSITPVTFSSRSNVFSLSLPRDNHLAAYMEEKARLQTPTNCTNLQKIKHSVSGGSHRNPNKFEDIEHPPTTQNHNSNWFFSRSAPNSLNSGFNSLEIRLQKCDEDLLCDAVNETSLPLVSLPVKSNSNGGRLMYLPEFETKSLHCPSNNLTSKTENRNNNVEYNDQKNFCAIAYNYIDKPKSRENMGGNTNNIKSLQPESLQDPPQSAEKKWKVRKPKKFTFQSTVRQIERKWLAEKLSREAERKEQQRLSELEAMQKVEEEFQRKRAKEKANIRHQLRLYSLDENSWSKNMSNWDNNKTNIPVRSEPDGAVSSSASSPTLEDSSKPLNDKHLANSYLFGHASTEPKTENYKKSVKHRITENRMSPVVKKASKASSHHSSESLEDIRFKAPSTQVLSEYRQSRREYKDYRVSSRHLGDSNESTNQSDTKHTTVHPQITYNMPKAAQGAQGVPSENLSYSNNYRKDFAHGIVLPCKSGGSTYSDDSQSNARTNSPRIAYHIT